MHNMSERNGEEIKLHIHHDPNIGDLLSGPDPEEIQVRSMRAFVNFCCHPRTRDIHYHWCTPFWVVMVAWPSVVYSLIFIIQWSQVSVATQKDPLNASCAECFHLSIYRFISLVMSLIVSTCLMCSLTVQRLWFNGACPMWSKWIWIDNVLRVPCIIWFLVLYTKEQGATCGFESYYIWSLAFHVLDLIFLGSQNLMALSNYWCSGQSIRVQDLMMAPEELDGAPGPQDRQYLLGKLVKKMVTQESEILLKECSICSTDFTPSIDIYEFPVCKHLFHIECLQRWLIQERKNTCPNCRWNINDDSPKKGVSESQFSGFSASSRLSDPLDLSSFSLSVTLHDGV